MNLVDGLAHDLIKWFGDKTAGLPAQRARQIELMFQDWESVWSKREEIMFKVQYLLENDLQDSRS